ncbi:MAG: bifunctional oligoribonuclease/PAP phosphatase NrnA [Clostridia bacterium]|nr:bifunctional oligoribonuclease/PAP phosphatase NrnA [Clostridia bacterium]
MLKKIAKRLKKAEHIAIFTHQNPDGDALGSSFAVKYALESIGKRATIYLEKPMHEKFNFLGTDYEIADENTESNADCAIVLDCGEYSRLGNTAETCKKIPELLCVDHHKTGETFGKFYYNEPDAAATAQIVYKLVNLITKNVSQKAYEAIYTGMSTDTGHFKFSNVNPETFRIAAKVLESGINHRKITTIIYDTVKREKMMFLGAATERVQFFHDGKIALLDCPSEFLKEYGLTYDDVDELPNIPLNLEGVLVSVLVKDRDENSKRVSLRTKDVIDVSEVAQKFSGGGHKSAAACVISGDIAQNIRNLVDTIIEKLTFGLGEKDV